MATQALLAYYNTGIEEERLSRNLCNRIEWETTLHVLAPYIPPRCRLLELGAAYGRYAIHYSLRGHHVTAVELVPAQVEKLKEKIARGETGALVAYAGDARDLSMIASASMDVVLCLGPLYHLQTQEDRIRCLRESLRVLQPGGTLAIAYLNRYHAAALWVKRDVQMIHTGFLDTLSDQGLILDEQDAFTRSAYFATSDEMEALATRCGATVVEHITTDGVAKLIEDVVNAMTEEQYQRWFQHHLKSCRERTILGASCHGLLICCKEENHGTA